MSEWTKEDYIKVLCKISDLHKENESLKRNVELSGVRARTEAHKQYKDTIKQLEGSLNNISSIKDTLMHGLRAALDRSCSQCESDEFTDAMAKLEEALK